MQHDSFNKVKLIFLRILTFFYGNGGTMAIKYKWLAEKLREKIKHNIENGINKLPTEEELSKKYRVSRQTVRQALALLQESGLVEKRKGSGTYITGLLPEENNQVALLINTDREYIYPALIDDIKKILFTHGYEVSVFQTHNHTFTEREILEYLLEAPPRGIIVEGCKSALPNMNIDLYNQLQFSNSKLVFLHNSYKALPNATVVKDDNYGGAYSLVKHFYELGHRNIGGIFFADDLQGVERYQGFLEGMRDYKLAVRDEQIAWFHTIQYQQLQQRQSTEFLRDILDQLLKSCSAILIYNDELAYWLIKELYQNYPGFFDEVALASFDNTYLSNTNYLKLTTLAHKPHEMGTRVAQIMIDKLKGLPVHSQEVPWELHLGESSRKRDS